MADLSSFRLVAHGGAPCPERVVRRLVGAFPPRSTWELDGSTEGTGKVQRDRLPRPPG